MEALIEFNKIEYAFVLIDTLALLRKPIKEAGIEITGFFLRGDRDKREITSVLRQIGHQEVRVRRNGKYAIQNDSAGFAIMPNHGRGEDEVIDNFIADSDFLACVLGDFAFYPLKEMYDGLVLWFESDQVDAAKIRQFHAYLCDFLDQKAEIFGIIKKITQKMSLDMEWSDRTYVARGLLIVVDFLEYIKIASPEIQWEASREELMDLVAEMEVRTEVDMKCSDIVRRSLFDAIDTDESIVVGDFEDITLGRLRPEVDGERMILYDKQFVYLPEKLFDELIEMRVRGLSPRRIKHELWEEKKLICDSCGGYTRKKRFMDADGNLIRKRFLTMDRDFIEDGEELRINERRLI